MQDVVTREGKMIFMYKRPGQRVIVNAAGHMMVRPTHMEASVQKSTGGLPLLHTAPLIVISLFTFRVLGAIMGQQAININLTSCCAAQLVLPAHVRKSQTACLA